MVKTMSLPSSEVIHYQLEEFDPSYPWKFFDVTQGSNQLEVSRLSRGLRMAGVKEGHVLSKVNGQTTYGMKKWDVVELFNRAPLPFSVTFEKEWWKCFKNDPYNFRSKALGTLHKDFNEGSKFRLHLNRSDADEDASLRLNFQTKRLEIRWKGGKLALRPNEIKMIIEGLKTPNARNLNGRKYRLLDSSFFSVVVERAVDSVPIVFDFENRNRRMIHLDWIKGLRAFIGQAWDAGLCKRGTKFEQFFPRWTAPAGGRSQGPRSTTMVISGNGTITTSSYGGYGDVKIERYSNRGGYGMSISMRC